MAAGRRDDIRPPGADDRRRAEATGAPPDGGLNLLPTSFTEVRINYPVHTQDAGIRHHDLLVSFQFGF
jgi:hypothetical protein